MAVELKWLPPCGPDWDKSLNGLVSELDTSVKWRTLISLARCDLNYLKTIKLERLARKICSEMPRDVLRPLRLALLGSSNLGHLAAAIRVAGLRRGLWIELYLGQYGQYVQELLDESSPLREFQPEALCFAMDVRHLFNGAHGEVERALDSLRRCWQSATDSFSCTLVQQTAMPVFWPLLGANEHRLRTSPSTFTFRLNSALESAADEAGVHLLRIDREVYREGIGSWYDPALWHHAKQEINPAASPMYGELLLRLVAAQRGLSAKCLVLDLDNTIWGGVIGDDGLGGIQLGQGSATGEAFLDFQRYVKDLAARGVILAICSKNDESSAFEVFDKHPEMILRRGDIACHAINWQNKAANLIHISETLNIGIDSLVFIDDNPFERELVRRELPDVSVPEMPEDPAYFVERIAQAGYFEGLGVTFEDEKRNLQYQANADRESLRNSVKNVDQYLRTLEMKLTAEPFDNQGLTRIVQLINKTNQFNLTTKRYSSAEVSGLMRCPEMLTFQLRLRDKFGDSGMISVLIARHERESDSQEANRDSLSERIVIDSWLMSCRVFGRQVEDATLNLLVERACALHVSHIIGVFLPTNKNGIVTDLYPRLGFRPSPDGKNEWVLEVAGYRPRQTWIEIEER